jgi:hypothetical protein
MGDGELSGGGRSFSLTRNLYAICIAVLLGPALIAWALRGAALAMKCAPGPDVCNGLPLGFALREALSLTWTINGNILLMLGIALVATLASFFARRPLRAALTLLLLPLAALIAPMALVYTAMYDGCTVSESGIGSCPLWGTEMGMSFHAAASVQWQVYGFVPYTFALALMLGIIGLFLMRPRPLGHATANPHRFPDQRFTRD